MYRKRLRRCLSFALAAVLGGSVLAIAPPEPRAARAADPPSTEVLVVNQENDPSGGCVNNPQEVLTANPLNGQRTGTLGKPDSIIGQLSDAKPIANNHKVVALWGGHDGTEDRRGGIGIYDRDALDWTSEFRLPLEFDRGGGNAHSVAYLPDGYFAVALVGTYAGLGGGWIVILSPTGAYVDKEPLASAHGVEWDERQDRIVAVGWNKAAVFSYGLNGNHMIAPATPAPTHLHSIPSVGGHDIKRRRTGGGVEFFVTTFEKSYRYNPDTGVFQPTGGMTKTNGLVLENHIKSMDEGWDGKVTYNQYGNDRFYFLDGTTVPAASGFCYYAYKTGRWLFPKGARVQVEDVPDSGGGGGGGTTCTTAPFNPTYTLGAMNPWWIELYTPTDVSAVDVIFNGGQHYFPMGQQANNRWGVSPPYAMPDGIWLRFVARRADGASAASTDFQWKVGTPQNTVAGWCTPWTKAPGSNEWWLEVDVSDTATLVEAKIANGSFTALDPTAWGTWAKSLHAPPQSKVIFRAYRSDGARAYSPVYTW